MADDRYRWTGVSTGTAGADYAAAGNWADTTTGQNPAPNPPGAGDTIVFRPVANSSGVVSLPANESAGTLRVRDTVITLFGGADIATSTPVSQTLAVDRLSLRSADPSAPASLGVYGVVLTDAGVLRLDNASIAAQPTVSVPEGIVVNDPGYLPHGDVHLGAAGRMVSRGLSAVSNLTDDGAVVVADGTLRIINPASVFGGVTGSGTLDVRGGATLDITGVNWYHNNGTNGIGTLHLRQGAVLNQGTATFTVTGDLVNDNSGTGNDYDPLAGILASPVQLGPGSVVNGQTVAPMGGVIFGHGAAIALGGGAQGSGGSYTLDLGSLHVGDQASASYTVENAGPAGAAALRGAIQTAADGAALNDPGLSGGGVTAQNFGPVAAGGSTAPYHVALTADAAGQGSLARLAFATDFSDSGAATLDITASVTNYATAEFLPLANAGALTHSGNDWTLDLGTLARGSSPGAIDLAVGNAAPGPADLLSGGFDLSGSGFSVSGTGPFGGVAAGAQSGPLEITADTNSPGTHAETLVLHPSGSNASGYAGALPDQTLTITDTVTGPPAGRPGHPSGRPENGQHKGWAGGACGPDAGQPPAMPAWHVS